MEIQTVQHVEQVHIHHRNAKEPLEIHASYFPVSTQYADPQSWFALQIDGVKHYLSAEQFREVFEHMKTALSVSLEQVPFVATDIEQAAEYREECAGS